MKKLLIALIGVLLFNSAYSQVKISDMPVYTGTPSDATVPVLVGGINRKMNGYYFAAGKIDSVWFVGNTLYVKKNSVTLSWTHTHPQTDINSLSDSMLSKVTRSGTYVNPSWITSLAASKITGLSTGAFFDTTTLQPRFNLKIGFGDSTTILAGRWLPNRSNDTATALQSRIQAKLNISDFNTAIALKVDKTTTVNGHALSSNVVVSASDITTGTIPDAQQGANVTLMGNSFNASNKLLQLDAGGKVPFAQLPAALMIYKGTWNAATNSPTLSDGTGVSGWVYIVSTGGTVNTGSGSITYNAGDYAIHNGSTWQRSVGTNNVASVNGQQGVVSLTTDNVAEGTTNIYFTIARVRAAVSNGTGLNYSSGQFSVDATVAILTATQTFTNKSMSGSSNIFTNIPMSALTGTLGAANGGTGTTSLASLAGNSAFSTLYLDFTSTQTISGAKTFSNAITAFGGNISISNTISGPIGLGGGSSIGMPVVANNSSVIISTAYYGVSAGVRAIWNYDGNLTLGTTPGTGIYDIYARSGTFSSLLSSGDQILSKGTNAWVGFEDRASPGTSARYGWYATGGVASLFYVGTSTNILNVTNAGALSVPVSVTVTNASASLVLQGTFSSLNTYLASITDIDNKYSGTPDGIGYEHAHIYFGRDGSAGVNTYGSYLAFYTENKSSGTSDLSSEKARFSAAGNFGVGTTNPINYTNYTTLSINNASAGGVLDLLHAGTSAFRFSTDGTNNTIYGASNGPVFIYAYGTLAATFNTSGNTILSGSATATAYIKSGGTSSQFLMADGSTTTVSGGIIEGTYTPTLTSTINISSYTMQTTRYQRIGNTVRVWGYLQFTPTSGTVTATGGTLSLPIASSLSNNYDLSGNAALQGSPSIQNGGIFANGGICSIYWVPNGTGSQSLNFEFTYYID